MTRQYWAHLLPGYEFNDRVRFLEDRGAAGIEVSQAYGPPFVHLAAAASITERLGLASGITMGLTRSPFETAMATIDLDRICNGRSVLGLGTGPEHFTAGYFGMPYDKPVSRLREVIQILRHVEDGARTGTMEPWNGKMYQLKFDAYAPTLPPHRERVPVRVAALRGAMCELAGELADGLIGHPIWSKEWALNQAMESLAIGAARSGRDPADIHLHSWITVSVDRDRRAAIDAAKSQVAYYAGFAQYEPYFEAHGFGPEARKLQEAAKSMEPPQAAAMVPDEMVKTFVACGTPDDVMEWIEPLWHRANSMLVYNPYWGLTPEQVAYKRDLMDEMFWPG